MSDTIKVLVKSKEEIPEEHFEGAGRGAAPYFNPCMSKYLGKVIEVENEEYSGYIYFLHDKDGNVWRFHRDWVIPVERGVWYENKGVCPVPEGTYIDVIYRNGEKRREVRAKDTRERTPYAVHWTNTGGPYDIMHWRYPPEESGASLPKEGSILSKVEDKLIDNMKAILKKEEAPATAQDFLQRAIDLLSERGKDYDQEEERSMVKTVQAFNIITGRDLTEEEGWLLQQILKDVRQWTDPSTFHRDSAEDCISYASLKAEALAKGE